jgi:formate hydrogenlyase subunit 6/NADH:ubiquinone oxidoreductase subunit I
LRKKGLKGKKELFKELVHNLSECSTIEYPAGTWPGKKFSFIVPNGRGQHEFDQDKCIGCGACRNVCPNYTIDILDKEDERTVSVFLGKCTFCGQCMYDCPEEAIILTPKYEFASTSKDKLYIENVTKLIKCKKCGEYMFPDKQLDRVKERILENIDEEVKETIKTDLGVYLKYCPECRKKISYDLKTHTMKYY